VISGNSLHENQIFAKYLAPLMLRWSYCVRLCPLVSAFQIKAKLLAYERPRTPRNFMGGGETVQAEA
jgi:hypothetical protein